MPVDKFRSIPTPSLTFPSFTTADTRNETELRAEIARLMHINAENSRLVARMTRAVEWLESQDAVFTPETCWIRGAGESLIEHIEALMTREEIEGRDA